MTNGKEYVIVQQCSKLLLRRCLVRIPAIPTRFPWLSQSLQANSGFTSI